MKDQTYEDVPATPTGESFFNPPTPHQVEHFTIGLEDPIDDIESLKSFFSTSIMLKIPRFSSLLVKHPNGKHYFRTTKVDIDKHFIVHYLIDNETPQKIEESEQEDLINGYLAELATAPLMSTDKPLWEIHVLVDVRCLVLRIHHSLGDGTCLSSMIREIGSSVGNTRTNEREKAKVVNSPKGNFRWDKSEGLLGLLRYVWFSTVFILDFGVKYFIVKDGRSMLKDEVQVEYRPRKMATARFNFDDVKLVKKAIPNATVNDVMCGIIWGGFKKYIDARSSSGDGIAPKEGQIITGVLMANVRGASGLQEFSKIEDKSFVKWWGNKTGMFLLPNRYTKRTEDALSFVRKAKSILDKKKQSAEPRLTLLILKIMFHLFGRKVASNLTVRTAGRVTYGFTNVMGPSEQISIADNPVTSLKFSLSTTPLGILVHLLSYKKVINMQILVDEDVIPDPKSLASCFEDIFQEMMDSVNDDSNV